ncbi:hypothetical protein R5W23_000843 [Gemmata sp. JC673]|uniref:Phage tail protein n=1 Tax=Gemmata algarum TaxID=2975278 RepID=A0ABU5EUJ6_9BACT|nr:hypothetical protein [Gemmata algarum]MDY3558122.1 hypothetical protein [Gemmata algarum]
MITGFQAVLTADDGGNGGATGGTSTKFDGVTTFSLPSLEAGTFDATELAQDDGGGTPAPDPFEREHPTGLIKIGKTPCEMKYTKANYQRLVGLLKKGAAGAEYTFLLTSPDDQTAGTATKLTVTAKGFVSKVDAVKFEKGNPVSIPFEMTTRKQPTYA